MFNTNWKFKVKVLKQYWLEKEHFFSYITSRLYGNDNILRFDYIGVVFRVVKLFNP